MRVIKNGEDNMRYCEALNAGLPSEPRAAGRRIGRLLDTLDREVNGYIVKGQIDEDIRSFRNGLISKLEADGWRVKLGQKHWSVLPAKGGKA